MKAVELPIMPFAQQKDWARWLDKQHATSAGIWMQLAKKDCGIASVTYQEALEVALCYGWIDGQGEKHSPLNMTFAGCCDFTARPFCRRVKRSAFS